VEPLPPDGSPFGVVDAGTTNFAMGFVGNAAYAQDEVVLNVFYTGQLTGVNLVQPVFGTEGNPIPEPTTAALTGFGIVGLLGFVRRFRRR
jgi:hypothetical protein